MLVKKAALRTKIQNNRFATKLFKFNFTVQVPKPNLPRNRDLKIHNARFLKKRFTGAIEVVSPKT